MSKNSIMNLESSIDSIKIIDDYLQNNSLTHFDYLEIFVHGLKMKNDLLLFEQAYHDGKNFYKNHARFDKTQFDCDLYYQTFFAALNIKKFDEAYQLLSTYKDILPIKEKYRYIVSLIEFKKATNQPYKYELEELFKDVTPIDVKIKCADELLNIYLDESQENKVIAIIDEIKKIDTNETYIPFLLRALYNLKRVDEAKSLSLKYINHHLYDTDAYLVLLHIYLDERDYHKAVILETDFEGKIDDKDEKYQRELYPLLINLYQQINNPISLEHYRKKLKNLDKVIKTKPKSKESNVTVEPVVKSEKSKVNTFYYQLSVAYDLLVFSHSINPNEQLREFLRQVFMKLDDHIKTLEYIIYTKEDSTLYWYKQMRLYDKPLLLDLTHNTIISALSREHPDVFGPIDDFKTKINILTQEPYDNQKIKYIYAFNLENIGYFIIHMDKNVNDPSNYYDLLRLVSGVIYSKIIDSNNISKANDKINFYDLIIQSPLANIRIQDENQATYNLGAQKLLSVNSHHPLEQFKQNMSVLNISEYEQIITQLLSKSNLVDEMIYSYGNLTIKEKMVSIRSGDENKIVSIFEDLSASVEEKKDLINQATTDFEVNAYNINALNSDLSNYIKDKGSFVLIKFNDNIKTIYGYETTLQFFKEFTGVTKKFFQEGITYRFDTYLLFVYLPFNDIRSVSKIIKDYLRMIKNYQPKVIVHEKFLPKLSIIRYPVVTEEKNPAKIYRYLELSLDKIANSFDEDFIFYEHRLYEDEVFEQQVIDALNEAIDNKNMILNFNQIIDLERKIIWQYESDIGLDHLDIDSKYLFTLAKKRNKLEELEKFHLHMVLRYLNTLERETGKLIKLTIPISKETLMNPLFVGEVVDLFTKYQIPYEFIRFKIKANELKMTTFLTQLNELSKLGIGLDTTNIDVCLSHPFDAIHIDYKSQSSKFIDYISMLKEMLAKHHVALIIRNVETKEQMELLVKNNIKYIEGSLYKVISADELIYRIKGANDGH